MPRPGESLMKVFISWSGDASREVARALRDWLPSVLQHVEPFMSEEDIETGARWALEIAQELQSSDFGLVCLTPDNWQRPWLNFEAGALSHSVDQRVAPFLLGIEPTDIKGPLAQFQSTVEPTEPHVLRLMRSINGASEKPIDESRLERTVTRWWPELDARLQKIDVSMPAGSAPAREEGDVLDEILSHLRALRHEARTAEARTAEQVERGRRRVAEVRLMEEKEVRQRRVLRARKFMDVLQENPAVMQARVRPDGSVSVQLAPSSHPDERELIARRAEDFDVDVRFMSTPVAAGPEA